MRTWHVSDVMTAGVVSAGPDTPYRDLVDLLAGRRINAVPVVDDDRRILGVVSESDLLRKIEYAGGDEPHWFEHRRRAQHHKAGGRTAAELMTAPAVTIAPSAGIRAAVRRMDDAGVKQLPVEDERGRLAGIVTRGDLLKEHRRSDADIRDDVNDALRRMLLGETTAAVRPEVARGVVTLTGRVERWSTGVLVVTLVRTVPGVVEVVHDVGFDFDDRKLVEPVPAVFLT
jgi:CBS-domain-containing membrane protein